MNVFKRDELVERLDNLFSDKGFFGYDINCDRCYYRPNDDLLFCFDLERAKVAVSDFYFEDVRYIDLDLSNLIFLALCIIESER